MNFLIADDHIMMRQAIIQTITDEWPDATCEEVGDGARLVERALEATWDMIISDITMPLMNGIDAVVAIKKQAPNLPVLIVTIHAENRYALRALRAGASGFVPKTLVQQELPMAIRIALAGKKYLSAELAIQLGLSL